MIEINIERGKPYVEDALYELETQIRKAAQKGEEILVIIHGYGSTGKGGKIGKATRELLQDYEREGQIELFVKGEDFDMFNEKARKIKNIDDNTLKYYGKGNYGISIIKT